MTTEAVTDSNLAAARSFLHAHVETSLFLLGGLRKFGPTAGEHPNSGDYRAVVERGRMVAVACPTRRGHLLAETGGREDLAGEILAAVSADRHPITGVLGEWRAASSLWARLERDFGLRVGYRAEQVVYTRPLDRAEPQAEDSRAIRMLEAGDFDQWDALNNTFIAEAGAEGVAGPIDYRRAAFARRAQLGHGWGAFDGVSLVSTAVIDEYDGDVAQVGGLFTHPAFRGHGLGRATMAAVVADARDRLGFRTLVLFADEDNRRARTLYESMGFGGAGKFGFFFRQAQQVSS